MDPYSLTVYTSPFPKIRVGKDYDGGYIIADIPNIQYKLLLSGGIDTDITFEEQFINKYNITQCFAFDASIESLPNENNKITFIKKYIGNTNNDDTTDLHDIINSNSNIFLKMDIEGSEIPWIETLTDDQLNKFEQMTIEFHRPFSIRESNVFNKLNKYHTLIHFHPNNCCGVRNHNNIIIPNIFECTYLHKKYFTYPPELNQMNIPHILDMKNTTNDDIYINYPPFVNKPLKNIRLCIFNSLPQHHEMFAHVLDYCKEKSLKIDVYTNKINNYGWLDFYEKEYRVISWYPISFFNPEAYDYVFLLTDDDHGYDRFWNDTTRVIVIEHSSHRELKLKAYRTYQTRQFKLRSPPSDPNTWMLPVWNNRVYEKYKKITVLSVGNASNSLDYKQLFSNYQDIDFILVDRHMDTMATESNIKKYNKLDASTLIEYAGRSHYILFWPTTSFSANHKDYSMSGSFPLAYSVGTPLIVPESFLQSFDLEGLLGIPDNSSIDLTKPSQIFYNIFIKQRDILLKRRNLLFDTLW